MHRKEAIAESLRALADGKVPEAVAVASSYTGGAETLYEKETIAIMEAVLEHDFTPDSSIDPDALQQLRAAAAATELWGVPAVEELAGDPGSGWTHRLGPADVILLLHRAGFEQNRLDRLRAAGVQMVEVHSLQQDPAPICREAAGRSFPIDRAPPLPHSDAACRCSYAPARTT